jgi:DNA-binding response OmpR family regulator
MELIVAETGAAVLEWLDREQNGIALIVLDGLLQDMSGLALCRCLRESEAGGSVLAVYHVCVLKSLPLHFLGLVFFADVIYLPPFWLILRWIDCVRRGSRSA